MKACLATDPNAATRRRRRLAFARTAMACTAAALLVVGCTSGKDSTSETSTTGQLPIVHVFDANRQAPAAPIPGAKRGGTVTAWTYVREIPSMDPSNAYYTS